MAKKACDHCQGVVPPCVALPRPSLDGRLHVPELRVDSRNSAIAKCRSAPPAYRRRPLGVRKHLKYQRHSLCRARETQAFRKLRSVKEAGSLSLGLLAESVISQCDLDAKSTKNVRRAIAVMKPPKQRSSSADAGPAKILGYRAGALARSIANMKLGQTSFMKAALML